MNMTGKVLSMVVVLTAMATVGCQKKVEFTFINHTDQVLPVKVTTPRGGTQSVGTIGANRSELPYTVRIDLGDLPAACSCAVGIATRQFTITQDTKGHLWFHRTKDGLVGPVDKKTTFVSVTETGRIKVTKPGKMVVE